MVSSISKWDLQIWALAFRLITTYPFVLFFCFVFGLKLVLVAFA
jgi:hypothetical protein